MVKYLKTVKYNDPFHTRAIGYVYFITQVSVQHCELLHEWVRYFHEPNLCAT